MKKTLAIILGGVTVIGVGLFVYLKIKKSKPTGSTAPLGTLSANSSQPTTITNTSGTNTSPSALEQTNFGLTPPAKETPKPQNLRPERLDNAQAIAYAIDYPESMRLNLTQSQIDLYLKENPSLLGKDFFSGNYKSAGSVSDSTQRNLVMAALTSAGKKLDIIKKYWIEKGRDSGHKVRPLSNKDETPITLNEDQAILYLARYEDIRNKAARTNGWSLDAAKNHWVTSGRSGSRKIDLY